MRRTGKQKLYGQRGASLLLALLLTLAASMVSMVIISASSTAVKRMYDDTERQQNYLTLESAAKLLKEELEDGRTTYKVEVDKSTKIRTSFQPGEGLLAETIFDALSGNENASFELPAPVGDGLPFQPIVMNKITIIKEEMEDSNTLYLKAEISLKKPKEQEEEEEQEEQERLKKPETQKLFLIAESQFISEEPSELDPDNALTYTYGFASVNLQTTRPNDAVSEGGEE